MIALSLTVGFFVGVFVAWIYCELAVELRESKEAKEDEKRRLLERITSLEIRAFEVRDLERGSRIGAVNNMGKKKTRV